MTILVSHQAVPPTFYNKIAPMCICKANVSHLDENIAALLGLVNLK